MFTCNCRLKTILTGNFCRKKWVAVCARKFDQRRSSALWTVFCSKKYKHKRGNELKSLLGSVARVSRSNLFNSRAKLTLESTCNCQLNKIRPLNSYIRFRLHWWNLYWNCTLLQKTFLALEDSSLLLKQSYQNAFQRVCRLSTYRNTKVMEKLAADELVRVVVLVRWE